MRRLTGIVSVIAALVVASTALLVVQTRQSAAYGLLSRALDRAGAFALAARTRGLEDGVLRRLAEELEHDAVLHACVYTPAGEALCDPAEAAPEPARARAAVAGVVASGTYAVVDRARFGRTARFELWFPVSLERAAPREGPPGPLAPAAGGRQVRVLLLVLDPASANALLDRTLLHAVLITLLLALLVGLTARQLRLAAREGERERERAAERRFSALGRMSAVLAHEIRNPLGAIKGFAQYTARRFEPDDPAREDMETIVAESARLERLVGSLLLVARRDEPQRREQDLRGVVERAVRLAEAAPEPAGVAVAVDLPDAPLPAAVDADQLTQALLNLVANAREAAAEGGGAVRVRLRADGPGRAALEVADDGPGIPEEHLADLFEPFVTHKARGTGLGLAVARRVAEAHGGRLEVRTAAGRGATFTLEVPTARPEEP